MIGRSITSADAAYSHELSEEIEWIINNSYLRDQLYRALVEQIHNLCEKQDSNQIDDKVFQLIQRFVENISTKMRHIAQSCKDEMNQHRIKIKQYQNHLQQKKQQIESLNQTIENLKVQINNWHNQYDNLKVQSTEMQERYERRLKDVKREKKEIKQTFRLVQENTEIERALIQNLQLEKVEISQQIMTEKREKQALIEQLQQISRKYVQSQNKLQASASKLSWQQKRIKKLQEDTEQKDTLIKKLMKELQQIQKRQINDKRSQYKSQRNNVTSSFTQTNNYHNEQQTKKYVSFVQCFKLSDQIHSIHEDYQVNSRKSIASMKKSSVDGRNYDQIDPLEINKSFANNEEGQAQEEIKENPIQKQQKQQEARSVNFSRVNIPDFYLAHFLLTSQAMKIKLNCQQYLGIDLASHYGEVVKQRIPFHMWDEWIKSKLKQLAL